MKISSEKFQDHQAWLFPRPIRCMAQTRNLCGDFFEQAGAVLGGHQRNKTDSTADYCPDLSHRTEPCTYYETKSVGRSSTSIIYSGRLEKDFRFVLCGNALSYCFWHHRVSASKYATVEDLYAALAASIDYLAVIPYEMVRKAALSRPLKCLNKKYNPGSPNGYANRSHGYGDGYSIPLSLLTPLCDYVHTVRPFEVFGNVVNDLKILTCYDDPNFLTSQQLADRPVQRHT